MTEDALTAVQREMLALFFDLPESAGFVLAGGAALIASGLSARSTNDIDLFTAGPTESITGAAHAFEAACRREGWTIERIHDTPTFRRLMLHREDAHLLVDLAVDSPPLGAPTITAYGPTYPPQELAARKILALYDRAAARDFVDLHALAGHFELEDLLELARLLDNGFEVSVFAEMLATLDRYTDDDLADLHAQPSAVRAFARQWRDHLKSSGP